MGRDGAPGIVLVVDDDDDVRESVAEVLRDDDFPVETARHGNQALQMLRDGLRPSLILLDLMMPVMDGFEFCRLWRGDPTIRDIPVVLLSADAATDRRAAECGATDYLRKPVDLSTLIETAARFARSSPATAPR